MNRGILRGIPVRFKGAATRFRSEETAERPYSACYAPGIQLYFQPDGDVRACCMNMKYALGNVAASRLTDIWQGPRRRELQDRLAVDDYSLGCQGCEWEVSVAGRDGSYPQGFDRRAGHLTGDPESGAWPRFMEFNLSNSCNLQCIQCNGDLSSSIRIHREGRPALPKVYSDEFFEDLALFLPHLEWVQFAGGEPFMGAENYRAWDLIAEVAPDLRCSVVTNATQWNKRVEAVLAKVDMGFTFSIDGITKGTYEAIRIDSDFDEVMVNLERFCEYARERGTALNMSFCLMAQNYHEFGDLLVFAEERGITVHVSVVHYPQHCSIARLDPAEIARIHKELLGQSDAVLARLDRNAATWRTEVARIGSWLAGRDDDTDHESLWGQIQYPPFAFARFGEGAVDDRAARVTLASFAHDGTIHSILVGSGDTVLECSESAAAVLGIEPGTLDGRPIEDLVGILTREFGTLSSQELLAKTGDQIDQLSSYGDIEVRSSIVALRDQAGHATTAALLFAIRPAVSARPLA